MSAWVLAAGADAKAVLATLAMMAVQGSVLALAAFVLVRAGKLRPSWQAAIWLVVLAKFALPWGPAMPWSLADLIAALHGGEQTIAPPLSIVPLDGPPIATPSVAHAALWLALAALWALGTLAYLTRGLVAGHRAAAAARRAPLAPDHSRAVLLALGGKRVPRLVVGGADVGPHVVGIFRPIIVIPPALVGDRAMLRAVLLHELAHVRRRDALARIVQLAATSLFFFWPLARLAARRLDHAREAACDVWAIDAGRLERPTYARLLVNMATLRAAAGRAHLAMAAHALDARVEAVLAARPTRRIGIVHALGLVAWIALSLGGARSAAAHADPVCRFSTQLASQMYVAHPEADLDGDGVLSRAEACDLQTELRKAAQAAPPAAEPTTSTLEDAVFVVEPLCCNSESIQGQPPLQDQTCHSSEGPSQ